MSLPLYGLDFLSVEMFHCFPTLADDIFLAVVIIMPSLGYGDQLVKMISKKSSGFLNKSTALILLFTNYLRFIYWIFEPFETYLLGQSVAVFTLQICLFAFSFYYEHEKHGQVGFIRIRERSASLKYFLAVNEVRTVFDFVISLSIYGIAIGLIFAALARALGINTACTVFIIIANLVDTTVSIPLFVTVVVEHRIENTSALLIGQYLVGDVLKLLMFWLGGSSWPFVFGALLQTFIDGISAVSFIARSRSKTKVSSCDEAETEI